MYKFVGLNGFIKQVPVSEWILTTVETCQGSIEVEHDTYGRLLMPIWNINKIKRSKHYFDQFSTFSEMMKFENDKHSNRVKARATKSTLALSGDNLTGKVHQYPNWFYRAMLEKKERANNIWKGLKPLSNDKFIGIEVELCSRLPEDSFIRRFKEHPLRKFSSICEDGSIETEDQHECDCDYDYDNGEHESNCSALNNHTTMEVRVLCKESELEQVTSLIEDFAINNKCYVNRTCGLHVHLDMRNRDIATSYSNLYNNLDTLCSYLSEDRLNNRYCKKNIDSDWEELLDKQDRYHMINVESLERHKTLEVRAYQGCLDGKEIKKWVDFLIDTVDNGKQEQLKIA